jgi:hypothetical protein
MPQTNNPAGRLYTILAEVLKQPSGISMAKVWSNIFHVDEKDIGQLAYYVWRLLDLLRETKQAVSRLENVDKELYLEPFASIEKAVSITGLNFVSNEYKVYLTADVMLGLRFVADTLSKVSDEEAIEQVTLDSLLKDIEAIILEVTDSGIDEALKLVILHSLEVIRRAILDYRLQGLAGLRQALNTGVGAVVLQQAAVKKAKADQNTSEIMSRVLAVFGKTERVVNFGAKFKQLVEPYVERLLELVDMGQPPLG